MSTLTENIPIRLGRKMNIVKEVTRKNENKLKIELSSLENFDDTQIPYMSSEEEQPQIDVDDMVKTHLRLNGGQQESSFQPLPSPPTVLPRTLKCEPSSDVGCTIDVDAANEAGQQPSDDVEQDVVGTQPQLAQAEEPLIQRQPLSTDVPSKENKRPSAFASEDEEEFDGCCGCCLFFTLMCCDFLG